MHEDERFQLQRYKGGGGAGWVGDGNYLAGMMPFK